MIRGRRANPLGLCGASGVIEGSGKPKGATEDELWSSMRAMTDALSQVSLALPSFGWSISLDDVPVEWSGQLGRYVIGVSLNEQLSTQFAPIEPSLDLPVPSLVDVSNEHDAEAIWTWRSGLARLALRCAVGERVPGPVASGVRAQRSVTNVSFDDAVVGPFLRLDGSTFVEVGFSRARFETDGDGVSADFTRCVFEGGVEFRDARFEANLSMRGATFRGGVVTAITQISHTRATKGRNRRQTAANRNQPKPLQYQRSWCRRNESAKPRIGSPKS